jgi:hypothetical protein
MDARSVTAGACQPRPRSVVRVGFSDRLQEAALAARTLSDGAFDPTIGTLSQVWPGRSSEGRINTYLTGADIDVGGGSDFC